MKKERLKKDQESTLEINKQNGIKMNKQWCISLSEII